MDEYLLESTIYSLFNRALLLRDKYISLSLQDTLNAPSDTETGLKDEPILLRIPIEDGIKSSDSSLASVHEHEPVNTSIPAPAVNVLKGVTWSMSHGVIELSNCTLPAIPSFHEFCSDLNYIWHRVVIDGPAKSLAFCRLRYLQTQFSLHTLLKETQELREQKAAPHRDFYNVRKMDTHVHHSSCMNAKHLLRFIKSKLKHHADDVVIFRDEQYLTLRQVFESLNLTVYGLSIDTLDMHAHKDSFHRFDRFNAKYNPVGESRLREIFLKTDNLIKGKYLAELTRQVFSELEASKYQMAEYRLSIYGRSREEWSKLAAWVVDNQLFSPNVRWMVQVPRLYDTYRQSRLLSSFSQFLENVFGALFSVTIDPDADPKLFVFLNNISGFDTVDDESKPERKDIKRLPPPDMWTGTSNPPYSYYLYYLWANITKLNRLRQARGLNVFAFRPHSGEAGDPEHLVSAFLTAQGINHGILLRKAPVLQYLYYLSQVHISMSPLSNNALFLTYDRNPFPEYFQRGLLVTLSTDDPLQFHFTKEPLIEEYSVAAQIWKLSSSDMCEIARNSVIASGFPHAIKESWLGKDYHLMTPAVNSIHKTNVPDVRVKLRHDLLEEERGKVRAIAPAAYAPSEGGESNEGALSSATTTTALLLQDGSGAAGPKPLSNIMLRELEASGGIPVTSTTHPVDDTDEQGRVAGSAMTHELTSEDDLLVELRSSRSRSLGNNDIGNVGKRRRHRGA